MGDPEGTAWLIVAAINIAFWVPRRFVSSARDDITRRRLSLETILIGSVIAWFFSPMFLASDVDSIIAGLAWLAVGLILLALCSAYAMLRRFVWSTVSQPGISFGSDPPGADASPPRRGLRRRRPARARR